MFRKSMMILSIATLTGSTGTSQQGLDKMEHMMRRSPELRRDANTECIEDMSRKSLANREGLAKVMNVGLAKVPSTFCRRVLGALASGRLKQSDLEAAVKGQATPTVIRILKG